VSLLHAVLKLHLSSAPGRLQISCEGSPRYLSNSTSSCCCMQKRCFLQDYRAANREQRRPYSSGYVRSRRYFTKVLTLWYAALCSTTSTANPSGLLQAGWSCQSGISDSADLRLFCPFSLSLVRRLLRGSLVCRLCGVWTRLIEGSLHLAAQGPDITSFGSRLSCRHVKRASFTAS
jgi:hypothetical protein